MISPVNRLTLAVGMVIATLVGQATAAPVAPSENVTINLIRLLVQQGEIKDAAASRSPVAAVPARPTQGV